MVDLDAISRSVRAAADMAAKLATAPSESMPGHDGGIRYLERTSAADGTNRVVATANAPAGLRLANIYGRVTIRVDEKAAGVLFSMTNSRKRYNLEVQDGLLWVTGPGPDREPRTDLEFTVPKGTPLLLNNHTGELVVDGDLGAPVRLELARGRVDIPGTVASARVRVTQTGEVRLGRVDGLLAVQVPAQADVSAAGAGQAFAEVNGAGTLRLGPVREGLTLSIPGSGDVQVASVAGPVALAFQGVGKVDIADGAADRFQAGVTGMGTVRFNGTAADPQVLVTGPGSVTVAKVTGTPTVQQLGAGKVKLGD
ncbi:hypothetical protein HHL28_17220 [Aerophototrophica crusticola]|uniref:Uncharacterized protein n=1 Tax=Aerophototrophica crusticola TaxID=1709002 RepID=A0A858RBN5_9PROT|nr:hypothetical protein HHL28_17220 [Rhodospirillaceae bacterium B3]